MTRLALAITLILVILSGAAWWFYRVKYAVAGCPQPRDRDA